MVHIFLACLGDSFRGRRYNAQERAQGQSGQGLRVSRHSRAGQAASGLWRDPGQSGAGLYSLGRQRATTCLGAPRAVRLVSCYLFAGQGLRAIVACLWAIIPGAVRDPYQLTRAGCYALGDYSARPKILELYFYFLLIHALLAV